MEQSILTSTKKILGVADDYTVFDLDIITHINAAFSILNQMGIGPDAGFMIEDSRPKWSDYTAPQNQLMLIKTYLYLKVRILFDPPGTSFLIIAYEKQIEEYETRLHYLREDTIPLPTPVVDVDGFEGDPFEEDIEDALEVEVG